MLFTPVSVDSPDVVQLDTILGEEAAMDHQHAPVQDMRQRQPPEGLLEDVGHHPIVLVLHLHQRTAQV